MNRNLGWCQKSSERRHLRFGLPKIEFGLRLSKNSKRTQSWENRIRYSEERIWDDVSQRISDVIPNFDSHPTTAPPSAAQDTESVIIKTTQGIVKKKLKSFWQLKDKSFETNWKLYYKKRNSKYLSYLSWLTRASLSRDILLTNYKYYNQWIKICEIIIKTKRETNLVLDVLRNVQSHYFCSLKKALFKHIEQNITTLWI